MSRFWLIYHVAPLPDPCPLPRLALPDPISPTLCTAPPAVHTPSITPLLESFDCHHTSLIPTIPQLGPVEYLYSTPHLSSSLFIARPVLYHCKCICGSYDCLVYCQLAYYTVSVSPSYRARDRPVLRVVPPCCQVAVYILPRALPFGMKGDCLDASSQALGPQ